MEDARAIQRELVVIRRKLHQQPELGFELEQTTKLVMSVLKSLSIPFESGIGGSGIVALIEGKHPGEVVGLRADMDALPIEEQNEIPYASLVKGQMHACGHDLHTTCLLGAARLLAPLRNQFPGTVKLIFQPAEEIDAGAQAMLADGVLETPKVETIFGLHNHPGVPTGCVAVRSGALMASIDNFRVLIEGQAAHGAVPEKAADALLAASMLVVQLQTIVSRNISPMEEAVVSVCKFQAGTADNIIADRAEFWGTVRAMDTHVQDKLQERLQSLVESGSQSLGTSGWLEYQRAIPVLINDKNAVQLVHQAASHLLGSKAVVEAERTMGGDDFALMLERVPGCYFWLGVTPAHSAPREWHTPKFDVDENALPIGSAVLAQAALNFLQSNRTLT
jgi:amidohydrolase